MLLVYVTSYTEMSKEKAQDLVKAMYNSFIQVLHSFVTQHLHRLYIVSSLFKAPRKWCSHLVKGVACFIRIPFFSLPYIPSESLVQATQSLILQGTITSDTLHVKVYQCDLGQQLEIVGRPPPIKQRSLSYNNR